MNKNRLFSGRDIPFVAIKPIRNNFVVFEEGKTHWFIVMIVRDAPAE